MRQSWLIPAKGLRYPSYRKLIGPHSCLETVGPTTPWRLYTPQHSGGCRGHNTLDAVGPSALCMLWAPKTLLRLWTPQNSGFRVPYNILKVVWGHNTLDAVGPSTLCMLWAPKNTLEVLDPTKFWIPCALQHSGGCRPHKTLVAVDTKHYG